MRRFIAGAVCPECRAVDRIVLEQRDGVPHRHCVSCGHEDTLSSASASEPATRLSRSRRRGDVPVSAVRIVDPDKGSP